MLFFVICAAFALFPENVLNGAGTGLAMCINAVIPSLLPFMVVSACIIKSGFARPMGSLLSKILTPLAGISSAGCVCFVTGLVGGYGAGARAVAESYRQNLIDKKEAERLITFCNNAGPLFIIGTVGVGFYGSKSTGIVLFLVQIITALICARIFSGNYCGKTRFGDEWNFYKKNKPSFGELVTTSAVESGGAIINACVFVILFSAITAVLPFGQHSILGGILEVTRGTSEMSRLGEKALPFTSAFLSWGGFSVHLQTDALCNGQFNLRTYYIGKIFASVVAYVITAVSCGDINILLFVITLCVAALSVWGVIRNLLFQGLLRQSLFRQQRHS